MNDSLSPVAIAREAVEHSVARGQVLRLDYSVVSGPLADAAKGVFVCLKTKDDGALRGCVGSVYPKKEILGDEIISSSISAATLDSRFGPVQASELASLKYSVDILHEPEPISGIDELDPQLYGVVVKSGRRTGLLLPFLEGINNSSIQLRIARDKAGILPNEPLELMRFKVDRYQ